MPARYARNATGVPVACPFRGPRTSGLPTGLIGFLHTRAGLEYQLDYHCDFHAVRIFSRRRQAYPPKCVSFNAAAHLFLNPPPSSRTVGVKKHHPYLHHIGDWRPAPWLRDTLLDGEISGLSYR